jgi:hypothetical protein
MKKQILITIAAFFSTNALSANPTIGVVVDPSPTAPQVYEADQVYDTGQVDNKVGRNDDHINEVGALTLATGSLHFNPESNKFQMAVGAGYFNDEQAVAWSAGMKPVDNAPFVSVLVTSTGDDVNGGFGVAWEF